MSYKVDWTEEASDALTTVWLRAGNRQAVTDASRTIDRLLQQNPLQYGIHLTEGLYAITVEPLRAQFEISEDEHLVTVVAVGVCAGG